MLGRRIVLVGDFSVLFPWLIDWFQRRIVLFVHRIDLLIHRIDLLVHRIDFLGARLDEFTKTTFL